MKTKVRTLAVVVSVMMLAATGRADKPATAGVPSETVTKPVQLALFPPDLQLVSEEQSISGLRLNIYGRNQDVTGVDIGLVHETLGNYTGVEFGLVNMVHGEMHGLQLGGIFSDSKTHVSGLQVGIVNTSASVRGVQIGLVNLADDMTGFQFGLFNQIKNKEVLPVLPLINANF